MGGSHQEPPTVAPHQHPLVLSCLAVISLMTGNVVCRLLFRCKYPLDFLRRAMTNGAIACGSEEPLTSAWEAALVAVHPSGLTPVADPALMSWSQATYKGKIKDLLIISHGAPTG